MSTINWKITPNAAATKVASIQGKGDKVADDLWNYAQSLAEANELAGFSKPEAARRTEFLSDMFPGKAPAAKTKRSEFGVLLGAAHLASQVDAIIAHVTTDSVLPPEKRKAESRSKMLRTVCRKMRDTEGKFTPAEAVELYTVTAPVKQTNAQRRQKLAEMFMPEDNSKGRKAGPGARLFGTDVARQVADLIMSLPVPADDAPKAEKSEPAAPVVAAPTPANAPVPTTPNEVNDALSSIHNSLAQQAAMMAALAQKIGL